MSRKIALLGVTAVSLCVAAASAEAKLIRYEINGQRYSYSTNNRQQTKEAKERIAAAAAAGLLKERAEAEAAKNPFVRMFGSPAQQESAEQMRVQQTAPAASVTENQTDVGSTSSVRHGVRRHSAKRALAREERRQAVREARAERQRKVRVARAQKVTAPSVVTPVSVTRVEPEKPALQKLTPIAPMPATAPQASAAAEPSRDSLSDFVNQVRKAPPEATGPRL